MDNFNKRNKFSGGSSDKKFWGRNFDGDRGRNRGFRGGRDGNRPTMHKAVCSDCGNDCEVPFRPTGEKPVFCSNCFKNKRDDNRPKFRDGRGGNKDAPNYKAQFEALNTKLDKILEVLVPVVSKEIREVESYDSKKLKKAPKKELDISVSKKVLKKTADKKSATKKAALKNKKK